MKKFTVALLLLVACVSPPRLLAFEISPLITPPVPLGTTIVSVTEPGLNPAAHMFITAQSDAFDILIMSGFRTENDVGRSEVRFTKLDSTCSLTFRCIPLLPNGNPLTDEACTNYLRLAYPTFRLTQTFSARAAGQTGPAYDLVAIYKGDTAAAMRVAFIPTAKGIYEFRLHSNQRSFGPCQTDFRDFLGNFRECPNGRADLIPPKRENVIPSGN